VAFENNWDKDDNDNGGKLLQSLQGKLARRESSLEHPKIATNVAYVIYG